MTEETQEVQVDELETLKARATLMGVKFHPNVKLETLKNKIEAKLNSNGLEDIGSSNPSGLPKGAISHAQFLKETESNIRRNNNNLVRVRVTCMNPNKKGWEGEIFTVISGKYGTYKKYVPFNSDEGWHVPKIIYEAMKERKFTIFNTVKGPRGEKIRKGKLVPEFSIEVLPPLTKQELKDLAQRQAMSGSTTTE